MGQALEVASRRQMLGRLLRVCVLVIGDISIIQLAVILALTVRFDGEVPYQYLSIYMHASAWYTIGALALFTWQGLYRSLWRYAGLQELNNLFIATTLSSAWLVTLGFVFRLPRLALIMQWFILTVLMAVWRMSLRALRRVPRFYQKGDSADDAIIINKKVLIVGAARPGADLVSPLQKSGRTVVGYVDDAPDKQRMRIHGVPVLGTCDDIVDIVNRYGVQEVLFALRAEQNERQREIVNSLADLSLTLRTIPSMDELIDGKVSISRIRPISIDDLLGRDPIKLNVQQIAEYIHNEVVLVTGAGGSIGSELCRQICRFDPALIILLGHGENSIFEAALDLGQRFPNIAKAQVIADVRDRAKMDQVFAHFKPGIVFHAAADKHVPFMEEFPEEAVKTNVFGTQNVAQAAVKHKVKKFVMISTDKAVNPTSVMGCSKRVAEMVVQDLNNAGGTRFVSVRFGNVLGSRGSVVPVFQRQIAAGGPITVTDPEMRRYFMTIPEAVQLVLQAGAIGKGGEVFILDMGDPVKIVDLARNLIVLSGFRPGKDIQIVFTGRRPGEKLFEELLLAEEGATVTEHARIFTSQNARIPSRELHSKLQGLERVTFNGENEHIVGMLRDLVRNYQPYRPEAEDEAAVTGEANEGNQSQTYKNLKNGIVAMVES